MSLQTYLSRMCYPLLYQIFGSAYYGIITTLSRCSYSEMHIRHEYDISVADEIHHITHCAAQHRSMISIQSTRMRFIELYQYGIFFLRIIIFRQIKYSLIGFILIVCPFHQLCSSPFVFTLLRISIRYTDRIGEIGFAPPQITEF